MNFLPANLVNLACLAAKETCRYALTGVSVTFAADGSYDAVATNGRYLGHFHGPAVEYDKDAPPVPNCVLTAPNSATSAIIPVKDWTVAFKGIGKKSKNRVLAIVPSEKTTLLASTDGTNECSITAQNVEGRFPDWKKVVPKKTPSASVTVDPKLLIEVLKVAQAMAGDCGLTRVTLEFYKDGAPVGIKAKNAAGQTFHGLLMPFSS